MYADYLFTPCFWCTRALESVYVNLWCVFVYVSVCVCVRVCVCVCVRLFTDGEGVPGGYESKRGVHF